MKKNPIDSKYYEDWFLKAKRDFSTAYLLFRNQGYTDTICYFCHQVAEKSLKSYLLFKGLKYLPRIHSLPVLLGLCIKENKTFENFKRSGLILNEYFIETKYPLNPPLDYSRDEAEGALKLAEEILDFVEKKLEAEK